MIRSAIFDLDGTLFDRATCVQRCVEAQYRRHPQLLDAIPMSAYVARFVELDAHGHTQKDVVYERLVSEYSLPISAKELLFEDFYAHYHAHAAGFPGLHRTLEQLRNNDVVLGMITNGGTEHQLATIRALDLESCFDTILISEAEGLKKPEPEIFSRALSRLKVGPREAVYIGDHPSADIGGAQAAGMWAIWKRDPYWGECGNADATIENLEELPGMLVNWPLSRARR